MIKPTKLVSICLTTLLLASLFLISGVSSQDVEDSILESANDDILTDIENEAQSPVDDDRIADTENDTKPPPYEPNRNVFSEDYEVGLMYNALNPNEVIGKYGARIELNNHYSSENNQRFYPSIAVKCVDSVFIQSMEITVTGTKPNGQPITVTQLTAPSHLLGSSTSQNNHGVWQQVIDDLVGMLTPLDPTGISGSVAYMLGDAGGLLNGFTVDTNHDGSTSVWTKYAATMFFPSSDTNRSLQLGVTLNCDTDIPGIYAINAHYKVVLVGNYKSATVEFDVQAPFEYRPPPRAYASRVESTWYTPGSGAGVTFSSRIIGSTLDNQCTAIYSGAKGSKAMITVELDKTMYGGRVYLYGRSFTYDGSHIYVYVSNDNNNWRQVKNHNMWTPDAPNEKMRYIACDYDGNNFKYVLVVAINDYGYVADVDIDAVHVYYY